MTSFRSLPLELRNIIYAYALEDDHDIFTDGLTTLFKVCPHITREIYSYRNIVTTFVMTDETPCAYESLGEAALSQYLDTITKFNQMKHTKKLVVRFKPVAPPTTLASDIDARIDLSLQRLGSRMDGCFTKLKAHLYSNTLGLACAIVLESPRKVEVQVDDSGFNKLRSASP